LTECDSLESIVFYYACGVNRWSVVGCVRTCAHLLNGAALNMQLMLELSLYLEPMDTKLLR